MTDFTLDSRLEADTLLLGDLPLCRVLLMNDARYPWLILVPRQQGAEEFIDLDAASRAQVMVEIAAVSDALKVIHAPDKLNVGALGNKVRQLHIHVLARYASDEAWPGPVWGVGQARAYPAHLAGIMLDKYLAALRPHGLVESEN